MEQHVHLNKEIINNKLYKISLFRLNQVQSSQDKYYTKIRYDQKQITRNR